MASQLARKQAQATLARLQEVGWSPHGAYSASGGECLMIAMEYVTGVSLDLPVRRIESCYTPRGLYNEIRTRIITMERSAPLEDRDQFLSIAGWNDDPRTTWSDVQAMLVSIIEDDGDQDA